jgi:hypothetical protein
MLEGSYEKQLAILELFIKGHPRLSDRTAIYGVIRIVENSYASYRAKRGTLSEPSFLV